MLQAEVQHVITGLSGKTLAPTFLHILTKEDFQTVLEMYNWRLQI